MVSYRSRRPKAVSKSCDLETERERCASREIGDRVEGAFSESSAVDAYSFDGNVVTQFLEES